MRKINAPCATGSHVWRALFRRDSSANLTPSIGQNNPSVELERSRIVSIWGAQVYQNTLVTWLARYSGFCRRRDDGSRVGKWEV